jgi:hypothetical protein
VTQPTPRPSTRAPNTPTPLWVAPLVLLIVAAAPWPYGYYMFLRMAVCGAAGILAYLLMTQHRAPRLAWAFVALALLYNPVIKVHFARDIWTLINLASAVPFGIVGVLSRRRSV